MFLDDRPTELDVHLQDVQPALQPVGHVHDAVFANVDVVDAVATGALGRLGDVVGDLLGLEGLVVSKTRMLALKVDAPAFKPAYTSESLYNPSHRKVEGGAHPS